jgi:hypothetical protein
MFNPNEEMLKRIVQVVAIVAITVIVLRIIA